MTDADRIPCCVPGCRRSFRADRIDDQLAQYMCGRCMRLADAPLLRRRKQLRARERRLLRLVQAKPLDTMRKAAAARGRWRKVDIGWLYSSLVAAFNANWAAIKRDAEIKIAMGADGAPRRRKSA